MLLFPVFPCVNSANLTMLSWKAHAQLGVHAGASDRARDGKSQ